MATSFAVLQLLIMSISSILALSNDDLTSKRGFRVYCASSAAAILTLTMLACTK